MPSVKEMQRERGTAKLLEALGLRPAGRLRPRHASEISGSPWSIGCETIDRGFVDFAQVGPHLGELGAKEVRLQAGWARCDPKADGRFEWAWLDTIVDGCVAQGVRPWLQTSYGNPAYPGGGGIGLAEGLPASEKALAAWDRWVAALADRYQDRVDTWEVWNEPDNRGLIPPEDYAAFFIRTARIIRQRQPGARMVGLSVCNPGRAGDYTEQFLVVLRQEDALDLIDDVCFHFYAHHPETHIDAGEALLTVSRPYAPHVRLRQGETGSPSKTRPFLALGQYEWSPRKQAAWNTRRMLAHHARGIPASLFQLADMYYSKEKGIHEGYNPLGL